MSAAARTQSGGVRPLEIAVNEGAERAVLGSVLAAGAECYSRAARIVRTVNFYPETHRAIFEAFTNLAANNRDIDLLTTTDQLERSGTLGAAGGVAYVANLADSLPDPANVAHYAGIVRDASRRRELQRLGLELLDTAALRSVDAGELAARVAGGLHRLTGSAAEPNGLAAFDLAEFMSLKVPPREQYVRPWLRSRDLVMIYGWRGTGSPGWQSCSRLPLPQVASSSAGGRSSHLARYC